VAGVAHHSEATARETEVVAVDGEDAAVVAGEAVAEIGKINKDCAKEINSKIPWRQKASRGWMCDVSTFGRIRRAWYWRMWLCTRLTAVLSGFPSVFKSVYLSRIAARLVLPY
jgi:hypothetical protein